MKARRGFSTSELTRQVRRLVAARLFLYLGAMSSYFIGVMGTLTFAMGAGVGDNAIAVALLNMCMVAGQVKGGGLLDRVGPQRYFRVAVACVGQFTLGVAFAAFGPIANTLVQVHAPLDQVGRVNAAMGAGYNLAGAIPLLCAPTLAHVFGVQGTLIAAGVAVAVMPLAILVVRRRELADLVRVERAVEERA